MYKNKQRNKTSCQTALLFWSFCNFSQALFSSGVVQVKQGDGSKIFVAGKHIRRVKGQHVYKSMSVACPVRFIPWMPFCNICLKIWGISPLGGGASVVHTMWQEMTSHLCIEHLHCVCWSHSKVATFFQLDSIASFHYCLLKCQANAICFS